MRVAEWRRAGLTLLRRGRPERLPVGLLGEAAVPEVVTEEAELPELIGDVLAHVRHDAVGPDDDLFAGLFVLFSSPFLFDSHDPAASEPSLGLEEDGAVRLQDVEGAGPELQAQD